ncbi:hypothetical protein [Terricaulis silvestris]|uniref:Lipoprotein n=1 Tax=Terricaulis silvestris TaxID=2686094 RepID=A0A6I6MGN3_9CAUL|nr:hypothetical protein [Terricaulis silvestris]QGZ93469.1 hypothetical protein DSM104635_00279 [Terricaulis silvestris]
MRRILLAAALALSACGQSQPPVAPEPAERVAAAPAPWFICDAINAPVVLMFGAQTNGTTEVVQYDKPNGALVQRTTYAIGEDDGAAGSVYTGLIQNGADAGHVRQINSGMLETPGSAYTPAYTSVRLGDRDLSCRWLPRTRLMGFTGRRTIVVSEDQDGDLLYHSYDFATAAQARPIDVSENGRTTTFSLEARGGAETTNANGATYAFRADIETDVVVSVGPDGRGSVEVRRHGPDPVQTEDLIAFVQGDAAQP